MPTKFHLSLNAASLDRSIGFYRLLFGCPPAKQFPDYAKFELDEPGLVLSLVPASSAPAGGVLNHAGLRVTSAEELVAVQRRMEEAGITTRREDGVACCYAKQTKFWVTDPDHTLWEVYVFHEDLAERGTGSVPKADIAFAKSVPRPKVTWEHRLPTPAPATIPHVDNSLDEVHLEGTINSKTVSDALFADAFRALRPGGLLRIHGLVADQPLPAGELPALPGPASVVEHVPAAIEPMQRLRANGFVQVLYETLSATAHFTVAGIGLRELVLTARKPGFRPRKASHTAVYLGPFSQVTDDFGNTFPRGERVPLNIHDWQSLSASPLADSFLLTEGAPAVATACCSSQEPVLATPSEK